MNRRYILYYTSWSIYINNSARTMPFIRNNVLLILVYFSKFICTHTSSHWKVNNVFSPWYSWLCFSHLSLSNYHNADVLVMYTTGMISISWYTTINQSCLNKIIQLQMVVHYQNVWRKMAYAFLTILVIFPL